MGLSLGQEWGGAYFGGKKVLDSNSDWKTLTITQAQMRGFTFDKVLYRKDSEKKTFELLAGGYAGGDAMDSHGILFVDTNVKQFLNINSSTYGVFGCTDFSNSANFGQLNIGCSANGNQINYSSTWSGWFSKPTVGLPYRGYIYLSCNFE